MARVSIGQLAHQILEEADRSSGQRFVDMRTQWRPEGSEDVVHDAGGQVDVRTKRIVGAGRKLALWRVHAGQLEAARWFTTWCQGGHVGTYTLALFGGRRSGKSTLAWRAAAAFAIAAPQRIVWLVAPTVEEVRQGERAMRLALHPSWYTFRASEPPRFRLRNGSEIVLLSASQNLKRGRCDLAVIDEAHLVPHDAYVQIRGSTADSGGLTILACNPPDRPIGKWLVDLVHEARGNRRSSARVFFLDPKHNPHIEHASLAALEHEVDEKTYRREVLGEIVPMDDVVLYAFSDRLNVRPPTARADVTPDFTQRFFGRPFTTILGLDFQVYPHMACVAYRVYADADGTELLHLVDETVLEAATEDELIDALERKGYTADATVCIADASGAWQDAERTKGRGSFDIFHRRGWRFIYKPDADSEKNPDVLERVKVANAMLCSADGRRRLFVSPECVRTIQALANWEIKNNFPNRSSVHAHLCDSATYPLWRFFPRKVEERRSREIKSWGAPKAPDPWGGHVSADEEDDGREW